MSPRWLDLIVDPIDRLPLHLDGHELIATNGARYPVIDGIPVLLNADLPATHRVAARSLGFAKLARQGSTVSLLDAVSLWPRSRECIQREIDAGSPAEEAAIRWLIPLTNGQGYCVPAPGEEIPIPNFPMRGRDEVLLDVGCSWGRWTIAAARADFRVIGIDPMLGPLMAAKRFAASQGMDVDYVCGYARCLPFADGRFDRVFSCSTLQHFSDESCEASLAEIARILRPGGESLIQMAHRIGVRSLWKQAQRRFRKPERFEVRYRSLSRMLSMFTHAIGPTSVSIDCFFGLGLQDSDVRHMRPLARAATTASEFLKRLARVFPTLRFCADSLFVHSSRPRA